MLMVSAAEAALVDTLKEAQVATAGDPRLGTIHGSSQHSSFVDADRWGFLQVVFVPDTSV